MKLLASRRDDLIQQRDKYDTDYKAALTERNQELSEFDTARDNVLAIAQSKIEEALSEFSALDFDVQVGTNYSSRGSGVQARIYCDERAKFDDNSALSWSYSVTLSPAGEVEKESNSWSGLKATTSAQMDSLVQTVEALKVINSLDWAELLNLTLPKYDDYVKTKLPNATDRPDFETEILLEEIREIMGQPKFAMDREGRFAYAFIAEAPKTLKACKIATYMFEMGTDVYSYYQDSDFMVQIRKDKLLDTFGKELNIVE